MGRHAEWRKIAKKERRRKIRVKLAKEQSPSNCLSAEEYKIWLRGQEHLESLELEQIKIQNEIENNKWLKAELNALEKWNQLQEIIKQDHMKKLEDENRIRKEWEEEQKKVKEAEERLQQIKEQNRKQQEQFKEKLQLFLSGDNPEPPDELLLSKETRPDTELCPFFAKTACCRFGDQCSRNHKYPGISKVLLATNLYTHFGLDNASYNEYDTDLMLEFEEMDMFKEFKEFYYDVLPEFQKFGEVVQFKVCNNFEKHLRGNTYIEFGELRSAVSAYISNHGRWYGGKQMSLQFCLINSWKNAICGLQSRRKCPKGRSCNFLHVFRNPERQYDVNKTKCQEIRSWSSWRWSESPEREKALASSSHRTVRDRRGRNKTNKRWSESPEREVGSESSCHRSDRDRRGRNKTNVRWSESPEREVGSESSSHRSDRDRRSRNKTNETTRHDRRDRTELSSRSRKYHQSRSSKSP